MTDGALAFNAYYGAGFLTDGTDPEREGNWLNVGASTTFTKRKTGGYISFGGLRTSFYRRSAPPSAVPDLIPGAWDGRHLPINPKSGRSCDPGRRRSGPVSFRMWMPATTGLGVSGVLWRRECGFARDS
jgi:hypothetical protein